jgi:hypothetical protein
MEYRTFNKIGEKVSLLGMGAMRLPENDKGEVDEAASIQLIRAAIDGGINYVDTAYTYYGGFSERTVGKALKDGYREKVLLADKMPAWLAKEEADIDKMFNKQLERLDTDCIDMYLIHNLTGGIWKRAKKYNVIDYLEQKKKEGKIKYLGFSFHDSYELFTEIVDYHDWDFCQIQLNYMDKNHQAGVKGLEYAASKGLGVIIMEPLKGGRITNAIPPTVQAIWDEAETQRTPVEWAFKWVAYKPEVTMMLSGMSNMEQLQQNLETFSKPDFTQLTDAESAIIDRVSAEYNKLIKYSCTGCNYCMPCPQRIDIPGMLKYYNDWNVYEHSNSVKFEYLNWAVKHASDCIGCQECEEKCPQNLPIAQAMKDTAAAFGK